MAFWMTSSPGLCGRRVTRTWYSNITSVSLCSALLVPYLSSEVWFRVYLTNHGIIKPQLFNFCSLMVKMNLQMHLLGCLAPVLSDCVLLYKGQSDFWGWMLGYFFSAFYRDLEIIGSFLLIYYFHYHRKKKDHLRNHCFKSSSLNISSLLLHPEMEKISPYSQTHYKA